MVKSTTGVVGPVNLGWFAIAVQALVFLSQADEVCPSATIAGNLRSHAVFMRRVLAQLVRARIVEAREGRDGGYRLARPAGEITLAEVYRAVKSSAPPELSPADNGQGCALGVGMSAAFAEVMAETEGRILNVLERHTIGELAARAMELGSMPLVGQPIDSWARTRRSK